jgi:hypothetical protein
MLEQPMKKKIVLYADLQRMMQDFNALRTKHASDGSMISCSISNTTIRLRDREIQFLFVSVSMSLERLMGQAADECDASKVILALQGNIARINFEADLIGKRMDATRSHVASEMAKRKSE